MYTLKTQCPILLFICLFWVVGISSALAQITLANQNAVNNFAATTTNINGSLTIGGSSVMSDITDLTPLANLRTIGGDLNITFNSSLTNLQGLAQLQSVGGRIFITNNPLLNDCFALTTLVGNGIVVINDNAQGCNSATQILQGPAAVIPTFSQWGIFLFGLLLLNLGLIFIRQAQNRVAVSHSHPV